MIGFVWSEVLGAVWPMVRCYFGWHSWKPVYRPGWHTFPVTGVRAAFSGRGWLDFGWKQVGCQCRYCGERK